MLKYEEHLDDLERSVEGNFGLGGTRLVNIPTILQIIEDMRICVPEEIKQASAIVAERNELIKEGKNKAESLVHQANERARMLVAEQNISSTAEQHALNMVNNAKITAERIVAEAKEKAQRERERAALESKQVIENAYNIANKKTQECYDCTNKMVKDTYAVTERMRVEIEALSRKLGTEAKNAGVLTPLNNMAPTKVAQLQLREIQEATFNAHAPLSRVTNYQSYK